MNKDGTNPEEDDLFLSVSLLTEKAERFLVRLRCEAHAFSGNRMIEFQRVGKQPDGEPTASFLKQGVVLGIPPDGEAVSCQLNTDLMMPAGGKFYRQ